ncbi:endo-1,4-beta-xylanase 5-like [Primulina tabacum]|uniref:endo-1,4-beta-xylanase 5-like n=1 Tax=Primulina tabacum TaxID=48773 RepID=UPI003F5AD0A2
MEIPGGSMLRWVLFLILASVFAKPFKATIWGRDYKNPEFNEGLDSWGACGHANISKQESYGNNYVIASQMRNHSHSSVKQTVQLDKDKYYVISAWIQVSEGPTLVAAVIKNDDHDDAVGWVMAETGCWSMLKGGVNVKDTASYELYFPSNSTQVDIWVDSVSLQPFTKEEWEAHQVQNTEEIRKMVVRFQVVNKSGRPLSKANISVTQLRKEFPFGNAISNLILTNQAYRDWFFPRFKYTVFENEMKWYETEHFPGQANYSVPDAMLDLVAQHGVKVRGHNVFWEESERQPWWVKRLPLTDLPIAADRRLRSVMRHYKGRVIHWDVLNENLHHSFFESQLGKDTPAVFYKTAQEIDPETPLFLNEFNTLEQPEDASSSPAMYLEKIKQIRREGYHGPLSIGLESHFSTPSLAYVRTSIDVLAASKLPIWITELDVSKRPNQELYLKQLLKELKSHPGVHGIIMWGSWKPNGTCYQMCLTDDNFKNLKTGDVVDEVIREWRHDGLVGSTDSDGYFNVSLFHGDYEANVGYKRMGNISISKSFQVLPVDKNEAMEVRIFI